MSEIDKHNKHLLVLGSSTVIVSFLVTSGYWDIFDLLISAIMLGILICYVKDNQDLIDSNYVFLAWGAISIISTALLISLVSVYAGISGDINAAKVAVENVKAQNIEIDPSVNYFQVQSIFQTTLFLLSGAFWGAYLRKLRTKNEAVEVEA
ncbi:hypothetical protein [Pseudoalteromonas sp. APM04]|uniref:hypothetical protein n=1 Tax=Pseudoalteromonas sp. APM04 TaxID=2699396 RepID=UPI001FB26A01|nr:hypothetical protein [Pseudoalteromonas sp. APM04]UOB75355.1 hypothetical protein MTP24_18575 [Pseudoalteromonas sp. APM04]